MSELSVAIGAGEGLDAAAARAFGVVPLQSSARELLVATPRPGDDGLRRSIELLSGRSVRMLGADSGAIARAQERVYGPAGAGGGPVPTATALAEPPAAPPPAGPEDRDSYRTRALELELPFVSLEPYRDPHGDWVEVVDAAAARRLTPQSCRMLNVIPLAIAGRSIAIATSEPERRANLETAALLSGLRAWVVVAPPADIERAIRRTFTEADELAGAARAGVTPAPAELELQPGDVADPIEARELGQILLHRGAIDDESLERALALQRHYGGTIGEVLTHNGLADEREVAHALAEQQQLAFTDPTSIEPDAELAGLLPERLARRLRAAPLATVGGTLCVAMANPLDEDGLAALREHFGGPVRAFVAPPRSVDLLLAKLYAASSVETASLDLLQRRPEDSASRVLSKGQRIVFIVAAVLSVICLVLWPLQSLIAFNIVAIVVYTLVVIYRFRLISYSLGHELQLPVTDEEIEALDEQQLPIYTILVPLYREPELIGALLESLSKLDYPKTKLDIKILLEEDDDETPAAFDRLDPPPYFHKVIVPDAQPKTKPKACNYGLLQARGEVVVIYDAEDEPETDQLKKAIVAFRKAPEEVVCLQCKLNYFNQRQTLLTRWFTSEYSMWFDLMLPGLDAEDVPIPLGGTSNHFKIEGLLESGAWDPFNVTEDADLGVRLHKRGLKTDILESTTYEEATSQPMNWIRQRSRWVKGYIQTWLVQMRHPLRLLREIGPKSFLSFQLTVGGTPAVFLLNPIYWLLTTAWLLTEASVIESAFPSLLFYAGGFGFYIGNFMLAYMFAAGTSRRGYDDLVKYALFVPVYWLLMSVAAWKGFLQLFFKPFYWEKTQHGGSLEPADEQA